MSHSEQGAAAFAALLAGVPLVIIGWRTIVFPHDSPYWPLLIPLALLILLAVATPVARRTNSRLLRALQGFVFYAALILGTAAAIAIVVIAYREFTNSSLEEPGLMLMVLTAAFVPTCVYSCLVLCIDQRKMAAHLLPLWRIFAIAAALPVGILAGWMVLESVG